MMCNTVVSCPMTEKPLCYHTVQMRNEKRHAHKANFGAVPFYLLSEISEISEIESVLNMFVVCPGCFFFVWLVCLFFFLHAILSFEEQSAGRFSSFSKILCKFCSRLQVLLPVCQTFLLHLFHNMTKLVFLQSEKKFSLLGRVSIL